MSWLQAIILGVVQGITEFLPVSSSGHLAITQHFFGIQPPLFVDVFVHLATLCATVWIFRYKIGSLLKSLPSFIKSPVSIVESEYKEQHVYIQWLFLSTLITAVIGFSFKSSIEHLSESISWVSLFLVLNGLFLISYKLLPKISSFPMHKLNKKKALWIGLAQSVALLPGISRSGMTISSSMLSGLSRKDSGEYAFLLSIPAILGAFLLTLKDDIGIIDWPAASLSFMASFISGYFCLKLFLKWIEQGKLWMFGVYCFLLGSGLFLKNFFS